MNSEVVSEPPREDFGDVVDSIETPRTETTETPRTDAMDTAETPRTDLMETPRAIRNERMALKDLIAMQKKEREEKISLQLINPIFQKKITQQTEEEKRELKGKYQIDKEEKYGRLRVSEVFRTCFHTTHKYRGNTIPKYPVLPIPSKVLMESLILPGDDNKLRMIGTAYCARSTNYSSICTKLYSTHRIVLVADPIHVAGGEIASEQFIALFFESYEKHFVDVNNISSCIDSMIEVITDLDLMYSKNHLVPVNCAILLISNEDSGFAKSKSTVFNVVMGNINLFKCNKDYEIMKINENGNYRIGDSKGEEIKFHLDWCYCEHDDMILICTDEDLKDKSVEQNDDENNQPPQINHEYALREKLDNNNICIFELIYKKFTDVSVAFTLNIDLWHQQSFMNRPKKEWLKPMKIKV